MLPFLARYNARRKYALRDDEHASGSRTPTKSKFEQANFLSWDGEGVDKEDGRQVYGLLANSQEDYWINPDGLSSRQCFQALTSEKYAKTCIHTIFGGSYDTTMMLRDLPEDKLRLLHKGDDPVHWEEFILLYRARKSLTVSRCEYEERHGKRHILWDKKGPIVRRTAVLWDVFGFFQKRFVDVLFEWFAGTPFEQKYAPIMQDIIKGKEKRGNFSFEEMRSFVLPYCLSECRALKDLCGLLAERVKECGLVLARWDGAGAASSAALRKFNVQQHIKLKDIEHTPEHILYVAEHAFYGANIETFKFGTINVPVHHYDIRSAYPDALRRLPSLKGGKWVKVTRNQISPGSLWIGHIEWQCPKEFLYGPAPFSWRGPGGYVRRPLHGKGWQWGFEIEACEACMPEVKIVFDLMYLFVPGNGDKPFKFIEDMYEQRRLYKEKGNGAEKVLKLTMNGMYGKTAQSLGYNIERGRKPPFHSPVYSGACLSFVRAKIMLVVSEKRDAIVSIATDGIFSLRPLDVDIGPGLGQWEYELCANMTLVQSGFYWYTSGKGEEQEYYRGFNRGSVSRQQIDSLYAQGDVWSVALPTKRFVTIGAAKGLNDFSQLAAWREKDRELDLYQQSSSKRVWLGEREQFDPGIMISRAKQVDEQLFIDHPEALESARYSFDWKDEFDGQGVREFVEELFHQE